MSMISSHRKTGVADLEAPEAFEALLRISFQEAHGSAIKYKWSAAFDAFGLPYAGINPTGRAHSPEIPSSGDETSLPPSKRDQKLPLALANNAFRTRADIGSEFCIAVALKCSSSSSVTRTVICAVLVMGKVPIRCWQHLFRKKIKRKNHDQATIGDCSEAK